MHFAELFDGHRRVNLGRIQFGMTEELLDVADVGTTLQHVRGAAMPEQVARALAPEPRRPDPGGHHAGDDIRVKRLAVARQEERRDAGVGAEVRAGF